MTESCRVHAEVPSIATCEDCRSPLCVTCAQPALGRTWCESCLASRIGVERTGGKRLKLPWLAFVLTVLPGLGQVYVGFVVRGIAEFATWWLLCMLVGHGLGAILPLAAALSVMGFWYWCGIDALRRAREVNARGFRPTAEEARSITRGPVGEQELRFAGVMLVVVGALLFAQEVGGVVLDLFRVGWPVGLIVLGAWILRRARARQQREADASFGGSAA